MRLLVFSFAWVFSIFSAAVGVGVWRGVCGAAGWSWLLWLAADGRVPRSCFNPK